ncbi:hypothetical protein TWF106_006960 [Orbilia oligospora]|uniref:Uncharacterized protein n=1 Tax=Orbilia oligospora TaxID=2813651 RepID=A0A7C8UL74_ORBOL|nr:hypothetical protein TWF788_004094 [Orbilia oligospora]KAF3211414.1 hypothetical protein TWF191_010759 [Orbilia oligospora]KAF3219809.1 hypothetical protein TWF106_006960 [Orbilia oligospora]KAF3221355.1 hypothetical protein TWF679_008045 [Orbilia oligospora]
MKHYKAGYRLALSVYQLAIPDRFQHANQTTGQDRTAPKGPRGKRQTIPQCMQIDHVDFELQNPVNRYPQK